MARATVFQLFVRLQSYQLTSNQQKKIVDGTFKIKIKNINKIIENKSIMKTQKNLRRNYVECKF